MTFIRRVVLYPVFLGMLITSLLGTLSHKPEDAWCGIVSVCLVLSSFLPLAVFAVALYFYARRFWEPEVPALVPMPRLR